jgi:hypothetical protein
MKSLKNITNISKKQKEISYVRTPSLLWYIPWPWHSNASKRNLQALMVNGWLLTILVRNVICLVPAHTAHHTLPMSITRRQARSCNHFCSTEVISITYSDWVFVAFGNQHTMCKHISVNCDLRVSKFCFGNFIAQMARFSKKGYWAQTVCFDLLYNFCLKHFSL